MNSEYAAIKLPCKTREFQNHHFDSTIWNDLVFRDDDIVIASYAKSGTTWLQQIVAQLLFDAEEGLPVADMSPWLDLRVPPKAIKLPEVEAQTHRRFLKTHLPVDALVFSKKAKYIYIGRDGRDVLWSMHHHHSAANESWYQAMNDTPGRVGPPIEKPVEDIVQYFHEWLDRDGYPWWPFWENVQSWWDIRALSNVLLLHFGDLKRDMPAGIRRIAEFIGVEINEALWPSILEHCSFDYMKAHATGSVPLGGAFWDGGAQTFINQGTNDRWRDVLGANALAKYQRIVAENLSSDCARWLENGEGY